MDVDPVFGLSVPTQIADVPNEVLSPRNTWPDKHAYDEQAKKLAGDVPRELRKVREVRRRVGVKAAGPK